MSRVAIVSDIHGNLPALEAVEADAIRRGCTEFLNLGDSLSGPLWPVETADHLMGREWPSLAGNHERQLLTFPIEQMIPSDAFAASQLAERHRRWLQASPPTLAYSDEIFLCHGTPHSDLTYFLHDITASGEVIGAELDEIRRRATGVTHPLIFCGHTHLPLVFNLQDGRCVANPGSVGLPAYDDDHPIKHYVEVGSPNARYAIVENLQVVLIEVEYDFEYAAAKAAREKRDDWAFALRTGFCLRR